MNLLLQHDLRVIARGQGIQAAELRRQLVTTYATVLDCTPVSPVADRVPPRAAVHPLLRKIETALTAEVHVRGWHVEFRTAAA